MTQNNKQILEQANAAVTKGDYESFLSFCTVNAYMHSTKILVYSTISLFCDFYLIF